MRGDCVSAWPSFFIPKCGKNVMRRKISRYRLFETDLEIFLMTHLIGKYHRTKLIGLCSMIIVEELEAPRSKTKTET